MRCVMLSMLLLGCHGGLGHDGPWVPPAYDAGPMGIPTDDAGAIEMPIAGRVELCGNALDDDADAQIDEHCACEPGATQACYVGPPGARGIGACAAGEQRCDDDPSLEFHVWGPCEGSVAPTREILYNTIDDDCDGRPDELDDGVCIPMAGELGERGARCDNDRDDDCDGLSDCADPGCAASCPQACAARETLCYGGHDDDCDGALDCQDAECAGDPVCVTGPCGAGRTQTYRARVLPSTYGPSSIAIGDGAPRTTAQCEMERCEPGLVAVFVTSTEFYCIPPPPPCPSGFDPHFDGGWTCDRGCELVIHYGAIYGGRTVCAPRPNLRCATGQVPTFIYETEAWACRPTCNDTLYDRRSLDGATVCVPC
jgi:hypothetical protein